MPSEDWIELKKAEWLKLLPAGTIGVGSSWDLDRDVTAQLLTRFYPTTETFTAKRVHVWPKRHVPPSSSDATASAGVSVT